MKSSLTAEDHTIPGRNNWEKKPLHSTTQSRHFPCFWHSTLGVRINNSLQNCLHEKILILLKMPQGWIPSTSGKDAAVTPWCSQDSKYKIVWLKFENPLPVCWERTTIQCFSLQMAYVRITSHFCTMAEGNWNTLKCVIQPENSPSSMLR